MPCGRELPAVAGAKPPLIMIEITFVALAIGTARLPASAGNASALPSPFSP